MSVLQRVSPDCTLGRLFAERVAATPDTIAYTEYDRSLDRWRESAGGEPPASVRERGADTVRRRLEELQRRYGPRFSPGAGWDSEHLNGPAP